MIRPDRVAIYIRWSTEDQGEGTTLAVQREGCTHYILSQGWRITETLIFVDDGYSGATLERPALSRLRALVAAGEVDCVVVFKLDRLSRSVVDTVNLVLKEWEGRTFLKSAREAVDTTTAMGKQVFYMLVSYAEWERSLIRERTHAGKLRRAREGRNPGFRPPFGYRVGPTPGSFAVEPGEAAVVRLIFRWCAAGAGPAQVLERLHGAGLRFRGRPFGRATLHAIISNPFYKGEMCFRPRGAAEPVRVVSPHIPPLVAPGEWEQARRARGTGRVSPSPAATAAPTPNAARSSPHLLSGLARCRCGHALYPQRKYQGPGSGASYYLCSAQREHGRHACQAGYVRQQELDALLAGLVRERFAHRIRPLPPDQSEFLLTREARREARQILARLRAEEQRALSDYRAGQLSAPRLEALLAQIAADRADAERRIATAIDHQTRTTQPHPTNAWEVLTLPQQKIILRALVRELTIYRHRAPGEQVEVQITWATAAGDEAPQAE